MKKKILKILNNFFVKKIILKFILHLDQTEMIKTWTENLR